MTDVKVPFGANAKETAILLLDAAENLGLDADVIRTNSDRQFVTSEEVAKKAGVQTLNEDGSSSDSEPPKAAKKTAAKKASPAKKAAAKKTTAKKSQG